MFLICIGGKVRPKGLSDLSSITRLAGSIRPGMGLECGNWNHANYAVFMANYQQCDFGQSHK